MANHLLWNNPDTIHSVFRNVFNHNELNELYQIVLSRIIELENVTYEKKIELIALAKEKATMISSGFYIGKE